MSITITLNQIREELPSEDWQKLLAEFALICAQSASVYSKDEQVHNCVRTMENYLKSDVSREKLIVTTRNLDYLNATTNVAKNAAIAVYEAASCLLYSGFSCRADDVVAGAIEAAEAAAEAAAYNYKTHQHDTDAYNAEKHRQVNLLRMLLED